MDVLTAAMDDHTLARSLAATTGQMLTAMRHETAGWAPQDRGLEGDRLAHRYLLDRLTTLRPHDCILSEEGADDPARLESDRVWIIDPLDGTREFSDPERDDWAVHVALWQDGELTAGAVARPALHSTLATDSPPRSRATPHPGLRIAVSRTRPPSFVDALAARLDARLVPMGSAGAKTAAVVDGSVDAYVHGGGQYEWDSAAPVAVARSAGLHTSRIDGSPLVYNQRDPWLPDLVICTPELAGDLLDALSAAAEMQGAAR